MNSRIAPADEHNNATPDDVEASPLLLDEPGALSGEGASPVAGILHERASGRGRGRAASGGG